jgi:hypothetical protein
MPKGPLGLVQGLRTILIMTTTRPPAGKTEVFSGKFCFSRRQAPHGLKGTTVRKIYPTLSVILIMCLPLLKFSLGKNKYIGHE